MRRIHVLTMALAACAAVGLAGRAAADDDKNMQTAMNAVFRKTGEVKKLKIKGHEFNVKQATITNAGGGLTIKGQLSHHLSFRDDDQVHYTITKRNGQILDIKIDVGRSLMQKGLSSIKDVLVDKLVNWIKDEPEPPADPKAPTNPKVRKRTPKEELDLLQTALSKAEELSGDGWEGAAKFIIASVAIRANDQGEDALPQLQRMARRPYKPTPAPGDNKPGTTPTKPAGKLGDKPQGKPGEKPPGTSGKPGVPPVKRS